MVRSFLLPSFWVQAAPVWEGILNHPRMAVFDLILRVTHMRPSELLALKKKDLVPPLVLLLLWWSVVITTSETCVPTKAELRDGSVRRWLQ